MNDTVENSSCSRTSRSSPHRQKKLSIHQSPTNSHWSVPKRSSLDTTDHQDNGEEESSKEETKELDPEDWNDVLFGPQQPPPTPRGRGRNRSPSPHGNRSRDCSPSPQPGQHRPGRERQDHSVPNIGGTAADKECHPAGGSTQTRTKQVRFTHLNVRYYERVLGDNPCCSSGPSVSIGWEYTSCTVPFEKFERARARYRIPSKYSRHMVMTRDERETMLRDWGYTDSELVDAVRCNVKAKNQRRQTLNNAELGMNKVEEMVEGMRKKLGKVVFRKRTTSKKLYET